MKTSEVAQLLGISANTVRTWTWREFRPYFSPSAQGGDGGTREFTDLDIQVMSHIAALSRANTDRDAIHADLQRLQADGWRGLPPMSATPSKTANMPVVAAEAAQRELDTERRALLREIATLQETTGELKADLVNERAGRREDLEAKMREITDLERKLSRAETLLELYESGRLKPPSA